MRLDIYDQYALNNIDIRTLCWPQEDINRRIGKKPLAYPGLKTTLSAIINVWLIMRPEDVISIFYVQLGLRNVN